MGRNLEGGDRPSFYVSFTSSPKDSRASLAEQPLCPLVF